MGILRQIKNAINNSLGLINEEDERKKIYLFRLLDERGRLADSFRLSTNNLNPVHLYINAKQRCTVQSIETVTDQLVYTIHAIDTGGKARTFRMERLS